MSVNPERSRVVISRVSLFEVSGGVGCRRGGSPVPSLVHGEDVEQRSGAEVVHVDHPVVTDREVLVLTEHVTALVLVLHDILVLQSRYRSTWFIIDSLLLMVGVLLVLGDPPAGVDAVDQGTQPQPDVRGRHVRSFAAHQH